MKLGLLIAVGTTVVAMAAAPPALARKLVVDDDLQDCRQADFTTIQAAVDEAPRGSKISVCPGTYREQVNIATDAKNGLRLVAKGRPQEVVVDGERVRDYGIFLQDVRRVLIDGFSVRRARIENIHLLRTTRSTVRENLTGATADHDGIILRDSHRNLIKGNVAFLTAHPAGCGISLTAGSSHNVVRDNVTYGNPFAGILVSPLPSTFFPVVGPPGPGNVIKRNVVRDNPGHGIRVNQAPDLRIEDNLVIRNGSRGDGRDGISVVGASTGVVVEGNRVVDNLDKDGIFFSSETAGNSILDNVLRRNPEHDCHDDSAGTGTAGTANVWEGNNGLTENRPGLCRQHDGDGGG